MEFQSLLSQNLPWIKSINQWKSVTTIKGKESGGEDPDKPHYLVLFFLSKPCSGCKQYAPLAAEVVQTWNKQKNPSHHVEFAVFDIESIYGKDERNAKELKEITGIFEIRSVPSIFLVEKTQTEGAPHIIAKLNHRNLQFIESWLQKEFYPLQDVNQMVAKEAMWEIYKQIRLYHKKSKELPEVIQFFNLLITQFNQSSLDVPLLVSMIPFLYKQYPQEFQNLITKGSEFFSQDPGWGIWFAKQQNQTEINLHDIQKLPLNEKIRDFLVKELYHFIVRHPVLDAK